MFCSNECNVIFFMSFSKIKLIIKKNETELIALEQQCKQIFSKPLFLQMHTFNRF